MQSTVGIENIAGPVLITGANGFLGTHLVRRFIDAGIRPRVFVLPGTPRPEAWQGKVDLVEGDIANAPAVDAAMNGCRTVFHVAALVTDWGRPEAHDRVTVGGTENVFSAAAWHHAHVVLVSSVAVYGHRIARESCHETLPFGRPGGPYGLAKQKQERIARRFADRVSYSVVRPGTVYGPGCTPWYYDLIEQLRSPFWPTLIGGGNRVAGLANVENVVDMLLLCGWHPHARGEVFNASDDSDITWRRYVTGLAEIIGSRPPSSCPAWLARGAARVLETGWQWLGIRRRPPVTREALTFVAVDNRYPMDKAKRLLSYTPRVGFEDGMAAMAVAAAREFDFHPA
jgi:nucleoside-diphosphate-sugar epimerase